MQRSAKCISISAGWQDVDELYSALPSLCLSPRCPASHLVYGPFLAAALHRNLRHQRQQLAVDIGHSCSQWAVGEEDDCGQTCINA